jgi:hypothetical protein
VGMRYLMKETKTIYTNKIKKIIII